MSAPLEVRELSPRGHGAVSVVALRGPGALVRARSLAGRGDLAPGDVRLVALRAGGEELDRALAIVAGPEDVELCLHGNPLLVQRLLAELGGEPAEPARGVEERAWTLLARAGSDSAARILLDQAEGALRREIEALIRADDSARLVALVERSRAARLALEPARVVLAGPVNAGKSTLFNLLLGERRAIESAEPGTTRDVLRERASFGAYPVELFDVAGVRELAGDEPAGEIERAGQGLAAELCARADWIVWLSPEGLAPPAPFTAHATAFLSRADESAPERLARAPRALSARAAPDAAVTAVHDEFRRRFELPAEPWSPGGAVAFDAAARAALDDARDARDGAARRAALARVLAPD